MNTRKLKPCLVCSSRAGRVLFIVEGKKIFQCGSCGLARTLGGVNVRYPTYHRDPDYLKFEKHFQNIFLKRYGIIKKYSKKGRVLEIGSSTGTFLNIFRKEGWEVLGVEPSSSALFAKSRGINVLNSSFEKADLKSNYFDLVVLNHTLEHFENPRVILSKVNKVLKRGGLVFIDVPNFGSLSSKLMGRAWPYILPNEHFCHFSPKSLAFLIGKTGFKIRYLRTRSGIFDYEKPLEGLFEEITSRPKSFLLDFLTIPGAFVTTIINQGTTLSAIGEK